jgi:hypothetical protein
MTANSDTPSPAPPARRVARRLRIIAGVILALGVVGAEVIYLRGRSDSGLDDASMIGYDKAATRQVGTLYGQQGVIVQEWANDLKRPGTQAVITVVTAVLVAGGCFYLARLMDRNSQ